MFYVKAIVVIFALVSLAIGIAIIRCMSYEQDATGLMVLLLWSITIMNLAADADEFLRMPL